MSWLSELRRGNVPQGLSNIVDQGGGIGQIFSNIQSVWTPAVQQANPGLSVSPNFVGVPSQLTSGSAITTPTPDYKPLLIGGAVIVAVLLLARS